MPRNRQQIPRAEREAAILEQARKLFVVSGYRDTSVASVARAAGVAGAAVHWYFPTKDDLFAAVLDSIFVAAMADVDAAGGSPRDRLVEVLARSQELRGLHRDAYERMDTSEAIRSVYTTVQDWLDGNLIEAISARLPEHADTDSIAELASMLFEGMLVSMRKVDRPVGEFVDLLIEALVALATAKIETPRNLPGRKGSAGTRRAGARAR